jgi:hypothetical protein
VSFASIWLIYDLLDFWLGGTQKCLWSFGAPGPAAAISAAQVALIASEAALLTGRATGAIALVNFFARIVEVYVFPLNDFCYAAISSLILTRCDCRAGGSREAPAWPRDVFLLQTAWIYAATALLKLNPFFLSGGDFFVRQNYLATALDWPYPAFYRTWIGTVSANALLAWAAVVAEAGLAGLLVAWWLRPRWRPRLRPLALALVIGIHGFAAATANVFFFGASMVAQVYWLTYPDPRTDTPCKPAVTV